MISDDGRSASDDGDVDALRDLLRDNPALVTSLVATPEIQPTSPLTYVGMARFYGYARHAQTVALARVLMKAGADKGRRGTERGPAVLRREPRRRRRRPRAT